MTVAIGTAVKNAQKWSDVNHCAWQVDDIKRLPSEDCIMLPVTQRDDLQKRRSKTDVARLNLRAAKNFCLNLFNNTVEIADLWALDVFLTG